MEHEENVRWLRERLGCGRNFDCIERHLAVGGEDLTLFYIDGFVKDAELQRVMQQLTSGDEAPSLEATIKRLAYVEVGVSGDLSEIVSAVLSGQTAVLAASFGDQSILIDARTYPARQTAEPDSDRVMQGARDGFVETLVMNTALIRRRIRDPELSMEHFSVGTSSKTDVVVCYMRGVASSELVSDIKKRIRSIKTKSLTLGYQSLSECLIRKGWLNPFPKIRTTERPDTAAAQIMEGSVILICDTSPQAMILPTSIFDYLQQTDDYYFPPLTGSYLRLVRTSILLLSLFVTPLWYFALENATILPSFLSFVIPDAPGTLPIIVQLLLVEVAIDGLKIASMNTPDMLSNSLSVIGALILGDFAVSVGWVCEDVILYMAFVALANFAQQNAELGYAIKFVRVLTLLMVYALGGWGLILGGLLFILLVSTNRSVTGKYHYLYPLIPFNGKALLRLIFRLKKNDVDEGNSRSDIKGRDAAQSENDP
ncbi:MAG: spore germination protein [Clostridia bacterium]|nr:spore germination protein [Clostridia bacterium]